MEAIKISRTQVTVEGGPLAKGEKWLVDVVNVDGHEFFALDKFDRKFRKWIGEEAGT